jgi:divalent metal cation (Fe/Co/Zn/Cd) transporter
MDSPSLDPCAWLSINAALATIRLKGFARLRAGSVGLLADALKSGVRERY